MANRLRYAFSWDCGAQSRNLFRKNCNSIGETKMKIHVPYGGSKDEAIKNAVLSLAADAKINYFNSSGIENFLDPDRYVGADMKNLACMAQQVFVEENIL